MFYNVFILCRRLLKYKIWNSVDLAENACLVSGVSWRENEMLTKEWDYLISVKQRLTKET